MGEVVRRLNHALRAIAEIQELTAGLDKGTYSNSLIHRRAVERDFEIMGEALGHAVFHLPSLRDHILEIGAAIGLRNRVIHGYDSVDDRVIWDTAQTHLPRLRNRIIDWLEQNGYASQE